MTTSNQDYPAFPCDVSVSRAWAVFENALKPLSDADYESLLGRLESGMSVRQYAAIKLRVPDSGDDWLDDMIRSSLRDELAAKAMQGMLAANEINNVSQGASFAYKLADQLADAMLNAREGK